MKQIIKNIFQTIVIEQDIIQNKQQKVANTHAYLLKNRHGYQPQAPIGFKSRKDSSYFLTTSR